MLKQKAKYLLGIFLASAVITAGALALPQARASVARYEVPASEVVDFSSLDPNDPSNKVAYLTDGDALLTISNAYGSVLKDKTSANALIRMRVEGAPKVFEKGVWAHAVANSSSNVYFDLREYHGEYDYLLFYAGLNTTANSSGNVKFSFYTSNAEEISKNAADWTVLPEVDGKGMTVSTNAIYVKLDIRNVNYLWLKADANGSNSNDHVVYGDLKLVKASYDTNEKLVPTVEEFDSKIKADYAAVGAENLENEENYQLAVLRRSLIDKAGRQTILSFLRGSAENREAFNWLYNNFEALKLYINGGEVSHVGTYENSLNALSELYQYVVKDQDDLNDKTLLETTSGTRGDLYFRMMMTIAITHGEHVRLWVRDRIVTADGQAASGEDPDSANISRPVDRYKVFKRMYLAGKLETRIFEQLEVEEMRYIMETLMGDDEIEWLHDYSLNVLKKNAYSYPPLPYRSAGYWHLEDYDEANQAELTNLWSLDGYATGWGNYKITNDKYQPHLWMIIKWGGVCWQISNTGQNMASSFGVPSTTLGQRPDHVAYGLYKVNSNGEGYWGLTNNVYGWTTTDYVSYDGLYSYRYSNAPKRNMNGWGYFYDARGYAYKYNGTYLLLAQAAINDYDNYVKAHELTLLAETYSGDLNKQIEIYEQALKVQDINLDAWLGLLQAYKAKYADATGEARKAADQVYLSLAQRITKAYRTFPVPMYDMLRWFYDEIEDPAVKATVLTLQTQTLQAATKLTATDSIQYSAQITMARHLMGVVDSSVATFSFDGDDAGKIKLNEKFAGAAWEYSLDGGQTWSATVGDQHINWIEGTEHKLSDAEIASITSENDIKIHFSGVAWKEENFYTIDITEQTLPTTLYLNDWENRVIGVTEAMEWRMKGDEQWISYRDSSPLRTGDVTIEVRMSRTGTKLASAAREFHFTPDTDTPERKYLPIAHISVSSVSSEATANAGNAKYSIDGTPNTRWHSAWNGTDTERWIIFEFDHDVYLTGLEYLPSGRNGRIREGLIEVSKDGENWTTLGTTSWASNDNWKTADFTPEDYAKYVRITAVTADNDGRSFISAKMFNFYEDSTKSGHPSAAVGYNTTEPTNGDVIARFIKPTEDTVITNNDGSDTYVFKENGSFVFEFQSNGVNAQAVARVDWIDKEAPAGRIEFYCTGGETVVACGPEGGKVNHSVEAKLVITNESDEVIVLNNGNDDHVPDEDSDDDAEEGGSSDLEDAIQALLLDGNNPGEDPFVFTFLRNGTFTFKVQDKAGNIGTIDATVDWIDMAAPKTVIEYSTLDETEGPVVARLVKVVDGEEGDNSEIDRVTTDDFKPIVNAKYDSDGLEYDEDFVVVNNGGSSEHTFTENGEFTFEYRDEAGNRAVSVAQVSWIQEKTDQPEEPNEPDDEQPDTPNTPDSPDTTDCPSTPGIDRPNDNTSSGEQQPGGSNNNGQWYYPTVSGDGNSNSDDQIANNDGESNSNTANGQGNLGFVMEAVDLPEGAELKLKKLTLTSALRAKFGADSAYFELNFVNEDGEAISERPEQVKVAIMAGKKLIGVYRVKDDGTTEKVDFEQVDDENIVIKNPESGKYLFDYEDATDVTDTPDTTGGKNDEESKKPWYETPALWWGVGGVAVLVVLGVAAKAISNRKR